MIEVFTGPMFSGKTESLIRARLSEVRACKVFKPACDTRDGSAVVRSHAARQVEAIPVQTAGDILHQASGLGAVYIDEVQFFGPAIISVVRQLSDSGVDVFCSGLDMDSNRLPFGCVGDLLAIADRVHKLDAVCETCGNSAHFSFRRSSLSSDRVFVGGAESYEPRCQKCWVR